MQEEDWLKVVQKPVKTENKRYNDYLIISFETMILEQYVFLFLVFSIFAYFLYTRLRYPFWSHMPVSHNYDMLQFSEGIIQSTPKRNKYVNQNLVKTAPFFELEDDQQKSLSHILNCFYIPSDVIFSTVSPDILKTRLSGHFSTPFVSADPSFGIGCAVSYPIRIIKCENIINANYLAYVATDRNQNISRMLISTHDYNSRTNNKEVMTTLYKKHVGKCAGAKPLIEFKTSVFYINVEDNDTKVMMSRKAMGSANANALGSTNAHTVQIYKSNWNLLQDFYNSLPSLFDFVAIMDIAAIKARVDANQMYIFAYLVGTQIMGMYFIEDMNTLYENVADYGGKTLSLVASVNNIFEPDGIDVFYNGFVEAVQKISNQNRDYKMMVIDDVGHNAQIVKKTMQFKKAIFETEGGYYWINYNDNSIKAKTVFVVA